MGKHLSLSKRKVNGIVIDPAVCFFSINTVGMPHVRASFVSLATTFLQRQTCSRRRLLSQSDPLRWASICFCLRMGEPRHLWGCKLPNKDSLNLFPVGGDGLFVFGGVATIKARTCATGQGGNHDD